MDEAAQSGPGTAIDGLADRIHVYLTQSALKAVFVAELETLAPPRPGREDAIAGALAQLEEAGRVLVRAHSCGDPHLDKIDLRVAVLVDACSTDGVDPIQQAVRRDQTLWDDWITEFLRNHRCQ